MFREIIAYYSNNRAALMNAVINENKPSEDKFKLVEIPKVI